MKRKNNKKEASLHNSICDYIKYQYPQVVFTSDASGVRLNIGQAKALKRNRSKHKIPDLIILEPNLYHKGLIIEIKSSREDYLLKNGDYSKKKQIQEQLKTLDLLNDKGYKAVMMHGFENITRLIDHYIENKV